MDEFDRIVNAKRQSLADQEAQQAEERRQAELARDQTRVRQEAELDAFLKTIRSSSAYQAARQEADSDILRQALHRVHTVLRPQVTERFWAKEGMFRVRTVRHHQTVDVPFEVRIEEITDQRHQQGITLAVRMGIGDSQPTVYDKEGDGGHFSSVISFSWHISPELVVIRSTTLYEYVREFNPDSFEAKADSYQYLLPDFKAVLELLAELVVKNS